MTKTTTQKDWRTRERQLLISIDEEWNWYLEEWGRNESRDKFLKSVTLVCAVLAPVAVSATTTKGSSFFDVPPDVMSYVSLVITLILAISEGIRRTFAFEERWTTSFASSEALARLRENYLDSQVGKAVGDPEWIANFRAARQAADTILKTDTQKFVRFAQQVKDKSPQVGPKK